MYDAEVTSFFLFIYFVNFQNIPQQMEKHFYYTMDENISL